MKQIFAIVAKDVRRFWPEILVGFSLLIALVLIYPSTWRAQNAPGLVMRGGIFFGQNGMGILASCLIVLVPIAWLVLIAGAVHCERLVGDTQFWLTRPYEWRRLLGAKLLYLAAFLYAPFFLAQCMLLLEAGFHPFHNLVGLLFNLLLLTAVGIMPVLALSSITTGFGRLTLVLLGMIITIVVVSAISSNIPSDIAKSVPDLLSGNIAMGVILCGSLAVVIVMYALRNAKAGWLMVGALTAVMCATAFFDPDRMLVQSYYPQLSAGSAPPVTLVYGAKNLNQPTAAETADRRAVDFAIPMTVSGVQQGSAVVPVALRVTILDASGVRWQSPWQGYESAHFLPGESGTTIRFRMRRNVYDGLKSAVVILRVSIALVEAREAGKSSMPLPTQDFPVPEIGVCTPQYWNLRHDQISGISCRSPMNQPQLTYVTAPWTIGGCLGANSSSREVMSNVWVGDVDPGPAEFGITSVWETPVPLPAPWPANYSGEVGQSWSLCPGTPVSFTEYRPALRTREDVTIPAFRLPEISYGDKLKVQFGQ